MPRLVPEEVGLYLSGEGRNVWFPDMGDSNMAAYILLTLDKAGDEGKPTSAFRDKYRFEIAHLISLGCVDFCEEGNRLYITHLKGRDCLRALKPNYNPGGVFV